MPSDLTRVLSTAERACVEAPAGFGKTEELVRAVARTAAGRQLILTHTHAGVHALRKRLKRHGVLEHVFEIDTIAGWCLDLATSYRGMTGLNIDPPDAYQWGRIYDAALKVLSQPFMRKVIQSTYTGIYVDEYQDCTISQHKVLLLLAELLPCRVLGDPLQGIFDFGGDPLVDWARDVEPAFSLHLRLDTPWRWITADRMLGEWLVTVREALLQNKPIVFDGAPLTWRNRTPENQVRACYGVVSPKGGSVVAIHRLRQQCYGIGKRLGGTFSCMEEMECSDLLESAGKLDEKLGPERAAATIDFAAKCMTKVLSELKSLRNQFLDGSIPSLAKYKKNAHIVRALIDVAANNSNLFVSSALKEIGALPGAVLYRKELWFEMLRTLSYCEQDKGVSLRETALLLRQLARQTGRRVEHWTVSTPLLIKGLEFAHSIVLDADQLTSRTLYVALTRASQSLTVLSESRVVVPQR